MYDLEPAAQEDDNIHAELERKRQYLVNELADYADHLIIAELIEKQ